MNRAAQPLLPLAAFLTALAAVFALGLSGGGLAPPALWHVVFAIGALPMILLAMAHFVPVLTRGGAAPRAVAAAPLAALCAGGGIVAFFVSGEYALRLASPWLALVAVAGFAGWLAVRWRRCLGRPHPGLAWYAAALGLLAAGLVSVGIAPWWPEQAGALRLFHLHINTLGFIGLTALGTMQVLLPTVIGRPDALAAQRLRQDLGWSAGGALAIAAGAAASPLLFALGAGAYAWPPARLALHAWRGWRGAVFAAGTTMPLLTAALAGLLALLAAGPLHAFGMLRGSDAVAAFVIGFLLPLLSGAAGHLLPVWLRPGVQDDWHRASRALLARGARARALLLLAGGGLASFGLTSGYVFGIAMALWLALSMLVVAFKRF